MGNNDENDNLIDRIIKDSNIGEDIKKNPGFGKPLQKNFFHGDVYSNFLNTAKSAGYLPHWISLQKEIREKISLTLKMIEQGTIESNIISSIDEINKEIKKYNGSCPPNMQRGKICLENIVRQYKVWE